MRNSPNTEFKKGQASWNWKGEDMRWHNRQVLIRDDYTSQVCGLRDPEIMEVDHIKSQSKYPELRFAHENMMVLCPNCHARKSKREKRSHFS